MFLNLIEIAICSPSIGIFLICPPTGHYLQQNPCFRIRSSSISVELKVKNKNWDDKGEGMVLRNMIARLFCHRIIGSSISFSLSRIASQSSQFCYIASETPLISLSNLFERYGFPPSKFGDFVRKNAFLLNSCPTDVEKSFKILLSLMRSRDFLISAVCSCPGILHLEFLEEWLLNVEKFGLCDITPVATRNILEIAREFELSPDDVFGRVMWFKNLGFREGTLISILESVPAVIMLNEDDILGKVEFLLGMGMQRVDIDRICSLFPLFLEFDLDNRLKPLFDEFKDLGFCLSYVRREVVKDPLILGMENGELSECLQLLRSLKCRVAIKENIYRDGQLRAGYKVKLRIDCLRKHGLIYRDAFSVLWKEPRVILYSIQDIEKKIDFLVRLLKFDIECLVEVPEYLGVNFDKQILPRFNVIEHLRSNGGLGDEVDLRKFVKFNRLRFYNMYVKPYPECEKMYGRFSTNVVSRNRHPVGLWKLLRPQKHLQTADDVENYKSFVKSLP